MSLLKLQVTDVQGYDLDEEDIVEVKKIIFNIKVQSYFLDTEE